MMKIVQIIPQFNLAGAEIMCENLSAALSALGVEVMVVSLYEFHSAITERLEAAGIPVIYLNKKPGLDLTVIKQLYELFRKERPDAIHTHLYVDKYAVPAALAAGIPRVIHTVHSVAQKESASAGKALNHLFFRLKRVTPAALSERIQETVIHCYHLSKDKVPVVLNGMPLNKCLSKSSYVLGRPVSILHVGRMTAAKNHTALLKAVKLLLERGHSIHLTLIGDGELRADIETLIQAEDLTDAVTHIPQTDNVFPYLNQADMFTLPSHYEGIPMSLIEAMGTGLPVAASAVGGIPDMIQDGKSGLLCKPEAKNIADSLERFILDENLRRTCGNGAKEAAKYFSAEKMAAEYLKLYQKI